MPFFRLRPRRGKPKDPGPSTNPQSTRLSHLSPRVVQPYQYVPLNEEAHEIRLLTLLPGTFPSEIRLYLDIVPFTDEQVPEFEALSYVWGSVENSVNIFIGKSGQETLAVTHNLAEALPYLRSETKPRVLWIDAVCVNQQNLEERGQQVKRMADIYSKAAKVLVWLGPESDDSPFAMACLDYIASKVKIDWATYVMSATSDEVHWADVSAIVPLDEAGWLAVYNLIHRPWFERLWIRQEVHLASGDVDVICGNQMILWDALRTAVQCIYVKPEPLFSRSQELVARIGKVYNLCTPQKNLSFVSLIDHSKHCACTDPRDKIYGLLSLVRGAHNIDIEPDYTKSASKVYQDTALVLLGTGKLEVLSTVESHEHLEETPSWVPNWKVARPSNPLLLSFASSQTRSSLTVENGGSVLKVEGVTVAVIEQVEPMHSFRFTDEGLSELRRIVKRTGFQGAPFQSNRHKSFTRTLLINRFAERFLPPIEHLITTAKSEEASYKLLMSDTDISQLNHELGDLRDEFVRQTRRFCKGRSFYVTTDKAPGLGPLGAKPGDHITVLLGCHSPMILRPTKEGNYKVVGEAYCDGFMNGEALLGPLPDSFEIVKRYNPKADTWDWAYMNPKTGIFQVEDPRLGPMPSGWSIQSHEEEEFLQRFKNDETGEVTWDDPRLTLEALRKRGVPLQVFTLV